MEFQLLVKLNGHFFVKCCAKKSLVKLTPCVMMMDRNSSFFILNAQKYLLPVYEVSAHKFPK